jgi:hypothetical protein
LLNFVCIIEIQRLIAAVRAIARLVFATIAADSEARATLLLKHSIENTQSMEPVISLT